MYDKDWTCGKRRRDIKFGSVPDSWTGFLITWDVVLYGDVVLSTAAGPSSEYTHWGHIFWPRSPELSLGNGLRSEKLEMSVRIKRSGGHYHDIELDYVYGSDKLVQLEARGLSSDYFAVEDNSQTARLYEGMLASKKATKAAKKEEL